MPLLFRHIKTAWKAFLNSLVFGRFLKTTFSHIFPFYENYLQKTMLVTVLTFLPVILVYVTYAIR